MRYGIAADHQGYELKTQILQSFKQNQPVELVDYGAFQFTPDDDYPDFVIPLAKAISNGEINRGIAICGSGIGACIAANKVRNVRAGIVHDVFSARQGVEDDNMNVICIAAQLVNYSSACELIKIFLGSHFSDEPKYQRRLNKISNLEMEVQK